tara:strand:- start:46 stop:249 length:204 start_codon:yes stop_codon:yes gene_type:complete
VKKLTAALNLAVLTQRDCSGWIDRQTPRAALVLRRWRRRGASAGKRRGVRRARVRRVKLRDGAELRV